MFVNIMFANIMFTNIKNVVYFVYDHSVARVQNVPCCRSLAV